MTNCLDNNAAGIGACAEFSPSLYVRGSRTIKSGNNNITNNNTKRARNNAGKHFKRRQSVYYGCHLHYDNATRVHLSPSTNVLHVYKRIVYYIITVYIYIFFFSITKTFRKPHGFSISVAVCTGFYGRARCTGWNLLSGRQTGGSTIRVTQPDLPNRWYCLTAMPQMIMAVFKSCDTVDCRCRRRHCHEHVRLNVDITIKRRWSPNVCSGNILD